MDRGLNYPLANDVITRQSSSSSTVSSITSPLHLSDIAASQPPASTAASQPHPPCELHLPTSKASPLTSSQPCPQFASSSSCTDTATQTMVHTGVQTENYHATPVTVLPSQPSQQSVASLAVSSQEYSKMEKLMATALLNAKDTINTIETLSQSLLLRNVSREASLASMPPGSYTQHVTYSQDVTNNPTVSVATIHDVVNHHTLVDKSNVMSSQDVANNPALFNAQKTNSQDAANTPVVTMQTSQDSSHLQNTAMTPPSPSRGNHMVTPPQHNYMLYNEVAKDDSAK